MYLKTKIVSGILFLVMLISVPVHAATPTIDPVAGGVAVANVSLKDAGILSQQNNKISIGFDLTNGDSIQSGVHYGVMLVSPDGKYLADETVYEESVTLAAQSTIHRNIVYLAPGVLSGTYTVLLESRNESNLPLDIVQIGTVSLSVASHGIYIDPATCYVQVAGEKSGQRYTLTQNVDIRSTEDLNLICSALNQTESALTVTPAIVTHYYSQFGAVVPGIATASDAISIPGNTQKTISVSLPKGTTPQLYNAKVSLKGTNITSNNIYVGYVISGVQGSVQQVSLDKESYIKGETGQLTLTWSAIAGNFARTGTKATGAPGVSVEATVSSNGSACANPINEALIRDPKTGLSVIPFSVIKNCKQPEVSVKLTDANGTILDQKTIGFTPTQSHTPVNKTVTVIVVISIIIIFVIAVMIIRRNHTVSAVPTE